jgi:transcriptional regulator with XRE-family HTH domain
MPIKQVSEQHQKRLDNIAIYLRELRFSEGLSQKELSQILNLHRNTIQRAENGHNLTLLTVFELADVLDISPLELFMDIE